MTVAPLPAVTSPVAPGRTAHIGGARLDVGAPFDVDAPLAASASPTTRASSFAAALAGALGDASTALVKADGAERAFTNGRGGMQEMVLQRAQADIALSVASAAASRTAQALATILNMQV